MERHQPNVVQYYTFQSFDSPQIVHRVFTRLGGVSPHPWAELNLGGTVGDEPSRVRENRRRALQTASRELDSVFDVWLVHGNSVACTQAPFRPGDDMIKADAMLTDQPGVTLFMRFADCVPILFHDPIKKVVGIAHAGWLGTIRGVVQSTLQTMRERYGCRAENVLAAIGPSIAAHHYEVGKEVVAQVVARFGDDASSFLIESNGSVRFDLWKANQLQLESCGVRHIECANTCTACNPSEWYSHRGESGRTGRFGALISLE
ncbi:MAG: peptidoglycan editing factor PgeF [Anaerolineales bacterium]|nr:peptidoglycan editing factor PgeF [Anaerolineales bacterium]MDD5467502.1 peptidoglycan editing factor PgeF [Anaerolineales bacterium]